MADVRSTRLKSNAAEEVFQQGGLAKSSRLESLPLIFGKNLVKERKKIHRKMTVNMNLVLLDDLALILN